MNLLRLWSYAMGMSLFAAATRPLPEATQKKPPKQPDLPTGWVYRKGQATPVMARFARKVIKNRPKLGDLIEGGDENGHKWGVFVEWHYHPPGQGFEAENWHYGATLVIRKDE